MESDVCLSVLPRLLRMSKAHHKGQRLGTHVNMIEKKIILSALQSYYTRILLSLGDKRHKPT